MDKNLLDVTREARTYTIYDVTRLSVAEMREFNRLHTRIRYLNNEIAGWWSAHTAAQTQLNEERVKSADYRREIDKLKEEVQKARNSVDLLKDGLKAAYVDLIELKDEKDKKQWEGANVIGDLNNRITKLNEQLTNFARKNSELVKENRQLEGSLKVQRDLLPALESKLDAIIAENAKLKAELAIKAANPLYIYYADIPAKPPEKQTGLTFEEADRAMREGKHVRNTKWGYLSWVFYGLLNGVMGYYALTKENTMIKIDIHAHKSAHDLWDIVR